MPIKPALVGKAGEALVAAELMRQGIDVAYPASDVGVDLLAYMLTEKKKASLKFVPIQVKSSSGTGFSFRKSWFVEEPRITFVFVWHVTRTPEYYIFSDLHQIEEVLGEHGKSVSWNENGIYTITTPNKSNLDRMRPNLNQWDRIRSQLTDT